MQEVHLGVCESTPSVQAASSHYQLPSILTSSTSSGVATSPSSTVPPTVAQVTSTSTSFSSTEPHQSETPLREFFTQLFHKDTTTNTSVPRRTLIGFGESLTEEEAMERVRVMEEEKKKMQKEKAERAERRKRKREEKETAATNKRKRSSEKRTADSTAWFCPYCLEPEENDNKVWMECDQCQFWYHATCAGYNEQSASQLMAVTFICSICEREKEAN